MQIFNRSFALIDPLTPSNGDSTLLIVSKDPTFRVLFLDGYDLWLDNLILNRLRHEKDFFRLEPVAITIVIVVKREFVPVLASTRKTKQRNNHKLTYRIQPPTFQPNPSNLYTNDS